MRYSIRSEREPKGKKSELVKDTLSNLLLVYHGVTVCSITFCPPEACLRRHPVDPTQEKKGKIICSSAPIFH